VKTGRVVFEGQANPPTVSGRVTVADGRRGLGNQSRNQAIAPDGSFQLDGLFPARLYVGAENLPSGWSIKTVTIASHEVTDMPFDYDGNGDVPDVAITLTKSSTELRGTLTDGALHPAGACTVIAFPEDEHLINPFSRRIRVSQSSAEGQFVLRGLPPGDYLLGVAEDIETGAWLDPAVLRTLRPGSTRIHLNEGEQKAVTLKFAR
jgi:hypothetical protein